MSTGINIAPSSDLTVGTTAVTSGTDTRVFFQAGGVVQQDANFTFDNTLKRLTLKAVGTAATDIPLSIGNSAGTVNLLQQNGVGSILARSNDTFSYAGLFYRSDGANGFSLTNSHSGYGQGTGIETVGNNLYFLNTGVRSLSVATQGAGTFKTYGIWNYGSGSGQRLLIGENVFDPQVTLSGTGNLGIGTYTAGARLDVRAQGALSTDIAFRVRNSVDTRNFLTVNGAGDVFNSGAHGVSGNTFYGENSGRSSTGAFNSFLGFEAGRDNSTGTNNSFFGVEAGRFNTSGGGNSFYGVQAGRSNTSGSSNSFFGGGAGSVNSGGSYNAFFGNAAGESNTSASFNSCLGYAAGQYNSTGAENVFLGVESGRRISSGANLTVANNSVFIGGLSKANANSETNQIVIGHSAVGLGSNTTVIGNTSTTSWKLFGAGIVQNITAPSSTVTDSFHVYSNDITAGNAAPHFRTEVGDIIKLYKQSSAGITTVADLVTVLTNLGLLG